MTGITKGLKNVYLGNVFIKGCEDTRCPDCSKIVVQRQGFSIVSNHIKNGRCGFCDAIISGVWE